MNELKLDNIIFSTDNNGTIKVINQTHHKLCIYFTDESIKFNGYVNNNFTPGMWVTTNPDNWDFGGKVKDIKINILTESQKYVVNFNREDKTFNDLTDKNFKLKNYEIVKNKISILIAAYKSEKYINETLDMFIKIIENKEYLDVEIIILIDGCIDTLKLLSNKVYPDYIKIYLSDKNYGLSVTKNTLVTLSSNDNFIFFDSDDIPKSDLINVVYDELNENDLVYYRNYIFKDGENYMDDKNLTTRENQYMSGCFGMKKSKFLEVNGFFPWRVQSDDEFVKRALSLKKLKVKKVNKILFYYRLRGESLSRDTNTNEKSFIRKCYIDLIHDKIVNGDFFNPNNFKYNKNTIRIQ